MKLSFLVVFVIIFGLQETFAQNPSDTLNANNKQAPINKQNTLNLKKRETTNNWSINVLFSDNGFGLGATLFKEISRNVSGFGSIFFSGAKDSREFEQIDIFGNTFTPNKINRLYMIPVNFGLQYRLFRESVTDELRPFVNFGITPTTIIYTPYSDPFFSSFSDARARFTVGAFAGFGGDYLTGRKSAVSLNMRYYYIYLFGRGVESLQSKEMNFFGGLYLMFSYNFMH